jgi:hypothetical protein
MIPLGGIYTSDTIVVDIGLEQKWGLPKVSTGPPQACGPGRRQLVIRVGKVEGDDPHDDKKHAENAAYREDGALPPQQTHPHLTAAILGDHPFDKSGTSNIGYPDSKTESANHQKQKIKRHRNSARPSRQIMPQRTQ